MGDFVWNLEDEKARFENLWEKRPHSGIKHSAAEWNKRADGWHKEITDDNNIRKARSENRVNATVNYLLSKGLLGPEDEVIDIGCGLGRFVAEFARTAKHVTGTDISDRMLELGESYAKEKNLTNTSFITADFKNDPLEKYGWERAFDLCFSSITPAVSTWEAVQKMEKMSRKYCFSANFVKSYEDFTEKMLKELFPDYRQAHVIRGQSFYTLYNLLFLNGRLPEVTYYKEGEEEIIPVDDNLADRIINNYLHGDLENERNKITEYIKRHADKDGNIIYRSGRWYSWVLWDVNDNEDRHFL